MSLGYHHHNQMPKPGPIGFSWFGSHPTHIVDTQTFQPNFRMFDFMLDADPPKRELMEEVWTQPEGERHSMLLNWCGGNVRCMPILVSIALNTLVANHVFARIQQRPPSNMKWSLLPFFIAYCFYHNGTRYLIREKAFAKDFQRNQGYAMEELKAQRDKQRVREALWQFEYVNDPYGEYRVKQWQVGRRFQ